MKIINSKEKIEELVTKNYKICYDVINKISRTTDLQLLLGDELGLAELALFKAACSFDESKNYTFYTYASICIKNEILCTLRHLNRREKTLSPISINKQIAEGENSINHEIGDIIEDKKVNIEKQYIDKEFTKEFAKTLNRVVKTDRDKYIILQLMEGKSYKEIAESEEINITRFGVQACVKRLGPKLRRYNRDL